MMYDLFERFCNAIARAVRPKYYLVTAKILKDAKVHYVRWAVKSDDEGLFPYTEYSTAFNEKIGVIPTILSVAPISRAEYKAITKNGTKLD